MRALWVGLLLCVSACDDYISASAPEPGVDDKVGWCAVEAIIPTSCFPCHNAASSFGSLDLQTDPHGALVDVDAEKDPSLKLVVAGDPDASFLLHKLVGELERSQGLVMPPEGKLDDDTIAKVRAWIEDGADEVCVGGGLDTDDITPTSIHPSGYWRPQAHGPEAKLQEQACTDCHGADLTGQGDAPTCDACHQDGWRTDCTFCHGDPAEGSGAPPVHLSGEDDGRDASFRPHLIHVTSTPVKEGFECSACHTMPTDILSAGHIFVADATPGVAETNFSESLSSTAVWDASTGACSNLYCHGYNGLSNGFMSHAGSVNTCHSCHPDATSGRDDWESMMSGEHEEHLREGLACGECHSTVTGSLTIVNQAEHVDGVVQVALPAPMSRDGNGRCTGACHDEDHDSESW